MEVVWSHGKSWAELCSLVLMDPRLRSGRWFAAQKEELEAQACVQPGCCALLQKLTTEFQICLLC